MLIAQLSDLHVRPEGMLYQGVADSNAQLGLRLKADAEPASHFEPPTCLLLHWRPDGGLVTHFLPVGAFPGPYPFA